MLGYNTCTTCPAARGLGSTALDLMLLLIKEAKKKCQMHNYLTFIQELLFEKEIKERPDKLQRQIRQEKLAKFKRDQSDYKRESLHMETRAQSKGTDLSSADFLGARPKKDNRIQRRPDEVEDKADHPKGRSTK